MTYMSLIKQRTYEADKATKNTRSFSWKFGRQKNNKIGIKNVTFDNTIADFVQCIHISHHIATFFQTVDIFLKLDHDLKATNCV